MDPTGTDQDVNQEPSLVSARPRFAPIPEGLLLNLDVSAKAVRLWGLLDRTASRKSIFPGRERLAAQVGVSVPTVDRLIKELVDSGWLKVDRRGQGRTNLYTLFDRPARTRVITDEDSGVITSEDSGVITGDEENERKNNESKKMESEVEIEHLHGLALGTVDASGADATAAPAEPEWSAEVVALCEHLADRIEEHRGRRPRILTTWYRDMDLLLRRGCPKWAKPEAIPSRKVLRMIDYVFDHSERSTSGFCWADQVQAPSGLRAKWDQLRLWANTTINQSSPTAAVASAEEAWMNRSRTNIREA